MPSRAETLFRHQHQECRARLSENSDKARGNFLTKKSSKRVKISLAIVETVSYSTCMVTNDEQNQVLNALPPHLNFPENKHDTLVNRHKFQTWPNMEPKQLSKCLREAKKEGRRAAVALEPMSEAKRIELESANEMAKGAGFKLIDLVRIALQNQLVSKAEPKQENKDEPLVENCFVRYMAEKRAIGLTYMSLKVLESSLGDFAVVHGKKKISELTRQDIISYIDQGINRGHREERGQKWKTRTKIHKLKHIHSLLQWCLNERLVTENVAKTIRKPRFSPQELDERDNKKQILTPEEAQLAMETIARERPHAAAQFAIMLFAGLRPLRESNGVKWSDVDFARGTLMVRGSRSKDRQSRYIVMTDNLTAWLKWAHSQHFPLPGVQTTAYTVVKNLVPIEWPHNAARHSFASYHLDYRGEDATRRAMGHGTFDMIFQHYRMLVKPGEGQRFFSIMPPAITQTP